MNDFFVGATHASPGATGESTATDARPSGDACVAPTKRPRSAMLRLAVVPVLLVCASCAVGPDYKKPAMPVPAAYKSAATRPGVIQQDWWMLFGDPTLNNLVTDALAYNYDLQASMARVEQARATAGIAKSGFFPSLSFNPALTRDYRGGSSGGAIITGSGTAISGGGGGSTYNTSVSLPFDLSYEVDLWGRVRRQFEAATARTQAAINDFGLVRLTVASDVAINYFNLRSLDAQDEIAGRNIETYKRQLDFLGQQTRAGFAAPLDVVQVKTLLGSTEATQFDLRRQRRIAEHALAILTGRPPSELDVPTKPLTESLPIVPLSLPADLLRTRPDVASAEANLIALNAAIGSAIANFLPTLSLGGSAGYRSTTFDQAFTSASRFFSLGPSLSVPLFDGSLKPGLNLARAQYQEQLANYRSTLLGAFRDVEDALTNIDLQARQAEAQARALSDAHEYVRLAEIQVRQGLITPLQVLDADRTLLQNELTAAQILNARSASVVQLFRALGGGWSANLPPAFTPTTLPTTQRLSD